MTDASFDLPVRLNCEDTLTLIERVFGSGAAHHLTQVIASNESDSSLEFVWESSVDVPDIRITLCSNGTWYAHQIVRITTDDGT